MKALLFALLLCIPTLARSQDCAVRAHDDILNMNSMIVMLDQFGGKTEIAPWCSEMQRRYQRLEDSPDLFKRCFVEPERGHFIERASAIRKDAHRAIIQYCR